MAIPTVGDKGASLKPLFRRRNVDSGEYEATVIAIPDLGASSNTLTWSDGNACWLSSTLPSLISNPCVFEFTYSVESDSESWWEQLSHCGDCLLEQLTLEASDDQFLTRPLIFLCHGLGGIVAKRAIGVLYEQFHDPLFDKLTRALSGIVFLGSPHPVYDKQEEWPKLALLLRTGTKFARRDADKTTGQVSTIARISRMFTNSGTAIPVLSAFEGKPTKIGTGLWSPRKILVDESFAKTGAKNECLVKVDTFHQDICNVHSTSALMDPLKTFFQKVESFTALQGMAGTNNEQQSLVGWTPTASEQHDIEMPPPLDHRHSGTNAATAGKDSDDVSAYEIIPLREAITGLAKSFNLPLYLLKPHTRNPEFYGRQDTMQRIRDALVPSNDYSGASPSGPRTFAICGPGGLGKTQIAVEFAYDSQKCFDAVFLLQASDTAKLAQSYAEIACELGLDTEGTSGDHIVSKHLVLGWLSQPVRQITEGARRTEDPDVVPPTWLLIFNNADDLSVLRDFWPVSGNGSILVTSRDPLAKTRTHVSVTSGIDLDPFKPEDGGQLLRQLTGYSSTNDVLPSEAIAKKLSGLPLAIAQIAGTIRRRDLGFSEFLELYEHEALRRDFYRSDVPSVPKTLYTVWAFEDLSQEALSLLNVIAFLDADQVPEQLLLNMRKLDRGKRALHYPVTDEQFLSARTELTKSSLVKRNRHRRELIIHRIIQDTARSRMHSEHLKNTFESVANLLYFSWPFSEFEHSTKRWRLCEPIVAHIGNVHRLYEESRLLRSVETARSTLARLFMDFGWYYFERGNIPDSLPYFNSASAICKIEPQSTYITSGDNHGCLAQIASTTNNPRTALFHAQKSVEIFEIHDKQGWRLPQAHNELCEAYIADGQFEEAIKQADMAIHGYHGLPDPEYPDWAVMNKGLSLCNLGLYEQASGVLEDYLEYRRKTFGYMDDESFKTGQAFLFLGKVRSCQGRLWDCLDLYLKALKQYHSTIGSKHFRVAALHYNIGMTYMGLGKFADSCEEFDRALELFNDKVNFAAQIARTLSSLSQAQSHMGRASESTASLNKRNHYMELLQQEHGQIIQPQDLDAFIPNWCA